MLAAGALEGAGVLVEAAPRPGSVLVVVRVRVRKVVARVAVVRLGRPPDEPVTRVISGEGLLGITVAPQDEIDHLPQDRQALAQRLHVVRVVVSASRVLQKYPGVQRGLDLVLRVIEKVS